MKVVHVLKKIEMIDEDVKELKKLEKSVARNKSFSTPIYMSIEKQINILLGERIKLLELKVDNPPDYMVEEIEGKLPEKVVPTPPPKTKIVKKKAKKPTAKKVIRDDIDDDDIPMLTQDAIDAKLNAMASGETTKVEKKVEKKAKPEPEMVEPESPDYEAAAAEADEIDDVEDDMEKDIDDDSVKLLDIALEKGTLVKKKVEREKKVRFFRENFPSD
ncbi:MAG: hypothetical protein GY754_40710 [bacterium]|nr:hypothetical protein [bacterium]